MIPVRRQPEPAEFDETVRQPGAKFLATVTPPIRWDNRRYWRHALPKLYDAYGGYCAYLALKIPRRSDGGEPTVDHFLPKSLHLGLAYEWSNFRLASTLMNTNKRESLNLLDPFELAAGWFVLDFPSLLTRPAERLAEVNQQHVNHTIDVLKLNHMAVRQSRKEWLFRYALGRIPFDFLAEMQPFVTQELQRQDLIDTAKLRQMFEQ